MLEYAQAKGAQSVVGLECLPSNERDGYAGVGVGDVCDRRVVQHLIGLEELGGFGKEELFEPARVDRHLVVVAESALVRVISEVVALRLQV